MAFSIAYSYVFHIIFRMECILRGQLHERTISRITKQSLFNLFMFFRTLLLFSKPTFEFSDRNIFLFHLGTPLLKLCECRMRRSHLNRLLWKIDTFCYLIKIIMQGQSQTDFTQRQDVIIFSQALANSSHNIKNIKNYRKLHDIAKRTEAKIPNSTQCTNDHGYIWTIDNSQRIIEHHSQQKMRINLDSLPQRRSSVTAGNSRKRNFDVKAQARTMQLTNNISMRENIPTSKKKQIRQNKFSFIQKKFNKGPIRDKYLSCWLNSLLIQACHGQKFDMTDDSPALKKYGLDQNSLRSKGIRPENLTRIYKSLFVYSIGFNDLLKDICDKNMNLRKTIWKVFAILLEYCAEGNFETMIAQIERDKMQKIEMLTGEIKKRQQIIDNNLQINQNKNAKIYKQIKQLREDNKNLKHDKEVLLQEFKQAEQAFNQQVSLRLRYENKINQIHGVFCQIQRKHDRLQHDHAESLKQLQKLRNLTNQQVKAVSDYKVDNQNKTKEMKALLKQIKFKDQLIGEMEHKKHGDAGHIIEHINLIKNLKMMIQQKNRQIGQLNLSINNSKLLFETQKHQHQQASISLAASLQQNSKLHKTIQQQMFHLNRLFQQKKNFGMKTSQIKAQTILSNNKLQQRLLQIKKLQKKIEQLSQETRKALTEAQNQKRLRIQFQIDLKVHIDSIKEMKHSKNVIEEQLIQKKRKMQIIDEIIAQKDAQIKKQRQQIDQMVQDLLSSKQLIKVLESKLQILNQKIKSIEDISNKKILALKQEKQKIQRTYMDFANIKLTLQLERDRLKTKFQEVQIAYKNEKFQRINLNVFYQNSLNTGQQKSEQIKKLDMVISEMKQEIENMRRQLKNVDYVNGQKQKQHQKEKKQFEERLKILIEQNKQRRHFIHPMVFEDVSQNFLIQKENYQKLKIQTNQILRQLNEKIKTKQQQIIQLKDKQKNDTMKLTNRYETALTKKQNQILYESNKVSHLAQKIKQLQQNLLKFNGQGKPSMSEEREQKYLNDIKQKKVQIQQLLKQLEQAHNSNSELKKNYMQYQDKIPQKQKQIQQLKKKIHQTKHHFDQFESKEKQYEKKIQQLEQSLIQAKSATAIKDKKGKQRGDKVKDQQSNSKDKKYDSIQWNRRDLGSADSKREDFAKKLKGAYIYYNK